MCRIAFCAAVLLLSATGVCLAGNYVVPTTTLTAQKANNTSAANSFASQTNGNSGASNVSKVDVHSLLYSGATTNIYAHLMVWFGGSNHMNVGYSSTDAAHVHAQVTDMISRGIDGVIVDWYGAGNNEDQATKLIMAEAESHPGFTFAIMIDQGAIKWDSCTGCSAQQALVSDLQYLEQTYFPSKAYMTRQGRPVVTNFDIDLHYSVDWTAAAAELSTQPVFLFQNNGGFSHVVSDGAYSWIMPTTSDYGMSYLSSFYDAGIPFTGEQTVGATYKGFNDSLASWGAGRVMGQQCGQTWLQTFSEINSLYHSGKQLSGLQLVTWNDYEEGTEIESGINNCVSVSASASGNTLKWTLKGNESTVDHYIAYISTDGQNLMSVSDLGAGATSLNLCSYSVPNGSYTLYVQAVGKPSMTNQISGGVKLTSTCIASSSGGVTFGASPTALTISSGGSGNLTITATPKSGTFNSTIALTCAGLPSGLSCSFSPSSITPGNKAASSVLAVSVTSTTAENAKRSRYTPAVWMFSLGLFGVTFIGNIRRKKIIPVLGACLLAAMIVGGTSCGGGSVPVSTVKASSSKAYSITINGASSSVQLSTTVVVTVK